MKRRERVLAAIDRREPDVLPVGFKATDDVLDKLRSHFGVEELNELLDVLDVDTFGNINNCLYGVYPRYVGGPAKVLYPDCYPDGSWDTIYGYKRRWVPFNGGRNDEVISRPLANAMIDDLNQHDWPQADWFDTSTIRHQCESVGDPANLFNLGGLGHVANLVGLERLMTDMLLDPPFIDACLRSVTDFYVELLDRVLEAAAGGIDIVVIHDDFGSQHGPMIGFDEYRRFYKPNHKMIFDVAHRHGVKAMMHSCGAVFDFVPEFIEIGADIHGPSSYIAFAWPARNGRDVMNWVINFNETVVTLDDSVCIRIAKSVEYCPTVSILIRAKFHCGCLQEEKSMREQL